MKIDFTVLDRNFRIETVSDTQVQLHEVKTVQDKESKNYGKEALTSLGYHADEIEALRKLNQVLPLTQPNIDTFEKLSALRDEVNVELLDIKKQYNL